MRKAFNARTRRFCPQVEQLETRLVPTVYQPTAQEQLFLEQLNDARANPAAYGTSIGLDLSGVAPSQPLAFNPALIQAADLEAQAMNTENFFAHVDPQGHDPGQRMTAAGFNWNAWAESIAAGYTNTSAALQGLIIDNGVPDLGHRDMLLAIGSQYQNLNQVGTGVVLGGSGQYQNYYVVDDASDGNAQPFITGVVFNDTNNTGHYAIGEGLSGVTISIAGVGSVQDFNTGGYSIRVNPGTYTVTASGGGLLAPITQTVTVGTQNVRLNFNGLSLPAPTLNSLGNSVSTLTPTFTWNSVPWATSYTVWVNDVTTGQSKALYITGLTGTSWTANAALAPGHTYRWWVEGVTANGGVWSGSQDFTVAVNGPTLQGPGGTVATSEPTFTWNSVPWASSYTIWLNDLTTGLSKAFYAANLSGTTWTPTTPLNLGDSYRWWVEGVAATGGVWSNSQDFNFSLPAPTPVSPTVGAGVLQPTFTWNSVAWATSYNVWVNDSTTGQSKALYITGLTGTSWTANTNLTAGHMYQWWVQGVGGGAQEWSNALTFTLSVPAPTLQGPSGTVTAALPTFTWNSVAWAQSYTIWIDDLTTGLSKALYTTGLTSTNWTPTTALNIGDTYRWWIQGVSSNFEEWSGSQDFTVSLPAPTVKTPSGTVATAQPAITWTGVAWATSYTVWVNDVTTGQSKALNITGLTGTSWTPTTALTSGHTYRTWVQAVHISGAALWSASQDFTVSLLAPTLQGPTGTITSMQPTFTWNSVAWASSYTIWVNDLTTGQSQAQYATNLGGTTWTPTTPLNGGDSYRWWIGGVVGSNTVWSASQDFTVQAPFVDPGTYGATIPTTATKTVFVSNTTQLNAALQAPTPGEWILLQPGTYTGGTWAGNFSGTAAAPIVIGAANPSSRPIIQGGVNGLQLSEVNYVVVRDLEITGCTTNGLNIDDEGNYATPTTFVTINNLYVHDIGSTDIENGIKLSGLNNFRVQNTNIVNWGQAGCAIDMVGCYNGCIQNSTFQFQDIVGAGGVQAKGGSTNITIRNNTFNNAGGIAVQAGGDTELQFFRQTPATYEGKNITITHNVIIGSNAAVGFVNAINSVASFNTIYQPATWVIRILQEDTNAGMVPTGNDTFSNNIVDFTNGLQTAVNYSTGTAPQTFTFSGNWWYDSDTPANSTPSLPATETGGTYGSDPFFVSAATDNFHLQAGSGAIHVGAYGS